jgi:hypothetical protein
MSLVYPCKNDLFTFDLYHNSEKEQYLYGLNAHKATGLVPVFS